ncbi:MAG: NAD(P)H-hydrate epimerase [Planctomycetota bacterium]|nr:NAD(P)H-hydrate epimerase [Planctomycetota bacterium]
MKTAGKMADVRPVSREEMRELDRRAIEEIGIPGMVLMENAGRSVAEVVLEMLARPGAAGVRRGRVAIVCGKGNNGGDGFVVARHLANNGVKVTVLLTFRERDMRAEGDAARNFAILKKTQSRLLKILDIGTLPDWDRTLRESDCVVDAIFGTGLDKPVSSSFVEMIETINRCGRPVVAVDVPSGLDCNTGLPLAFAMEAEVTVTFAAPKTGFFRHGARRFTGRVVVADIGIPRKLLPKKAAKTQRHGD